MHTLNQFWPLKDLSTYALSTARHASRNSSCSDVTAWLGRQPGPNASNAAAAAAASLAPSCVWEKCVCIAKGVVRGYACTCIGPECDCTKHQQQRQCPAPAGGLHHVRWHALRQLPLVRPCTQEVTWWDHAQVVGHCQVHVCIIHPTYACMACWGDW